MKSPTFRFEVVIRWSDEDQAYVAMVPDLPGCMADGASYEDAVQNVQVVMREWIEAAAELGRGIREASVHLTAGR